MKDFIRFPRENGYMALHAPIRIKGYPSVIQVQVRHPSSLLLPSTTASRLSHSQS